MLVKKFNCPKKPNSVKTTKASHNLRLGFPQIEDHSTAAHCIHEYAKLDGWSGVLLKLVAADGHTEFCSRVRSFLQQHKHITQLFENVDYIEF
jgi:hypothetical protein